MATNSEETKRFFANSIRREKGDTQQSLFITPSFNSEGKPVVSLADLLNDDEPTAIIWVDVRRIKVVGSKKYNPSGNPDVMSAEFLADDKGPLPYESNKQGIIPLPPRVLRALKEKINLYREPLD